MLRKTKKGIRIKIFVGKRGSIFWLDCVYMLKNVNRKSHPSENDKNALSHWALELIAFYLCRGRRAPEKDKREGIKNNCNQTRMLHVIEVIYERASCSHGNSALFDSSVEFPRFFFCSIPPRQLGTVITTMMLYSLVCVPPFFTSTTTTLLLFF